jgi:hypothetical protein
VSQCPYISICSHLSGNLVVHGYAIWEAGWHTLPIYSFYNLHDL